MQSKARHICLDAGQSRAVRFLSGLHVNLEDGKKSSWVTLTRTGKFTDPRYGDFEITRSMLLAMVDNFNKGVFGQDVFIDVAHRPNDGAAAKVLKLSVEGDRLRALCEWTPFGLDAIKNKGYRYLSLEYHEHWTDNETRVNHGPVPSAFSRMINILERTADIGARHAANFVGLAWRDGQLIVNEGPDCYFTEPEKQCPYHNLTFPTGTVREARQVLNAFQSTFKKNAATFPLVWALGGHLKVLLGFWPHMMIQASKGSGKSTLIKRLERAIAFTMFSGQSLSTEFRLLTSISATSHPVGWEELSARRQDVIDKAVGMLQENYQYTVTRRGTEMTEYLLAAPVLLAGEDVPVRSLLGKIIRTDLSGKKGPLMPDELPRFPVRAWLEFLSRLSRTEVLQRYRDVRQMCLSASRASGQDDGALRMSANYAAVFLAWQYLCEFVGYEHDHGDFDADLFEEMNRHIGETSADREPWVWIMETALSEIAAGRFTFPYAWKDPKDEEHAALLIRTSHIMDHISTTPALREKWNGLPVKSDRVFKKQMMDAGVIEDQPVEKTIGNKRVSNLQVIPLKKLATFGLYATPSEDRGYHE